MVSTGRRDRRHRLRFPLRLADGSRVVVRDLSAGGMYVETPAALPLGQVLLFELRPPGSRLVFTARGVVIEVNSPRRPPGARVRFTDLRMVTAR